MKTLVQALVALGVMIGSLVGVAALLMAVAPGGLAGAGYVIVIGSFVLSVWLLRLFGILSRRDMDNAGIMYKPLPWAKMAAIILIGGCSLALLWAMVASVLH